MRNLDCRYTVSRTGISPPSWGCGCCKLTPQLSDHHISEMGEHGMKFSRLQCFTMQAHLEVEGIMGFPSLALLQESQRICTHLIAPSQGSGAGVSSFLSQSSTFPISNSHFFTSSSSFPSFATPPSQSSIKSLSLSPVTAQLRLHVHLWLKPPAVDHG